MFKRNRESEKINLLDTDLGTAVKQRMRSESSGNVAILASLIGSVVIAGGVFAGFLLKDNGIKNDIDDCNKFINSEDTANKLRHHDHLQELKKTVNAYYTKIQNAETAYLSQPVITGEVYDELEKILKDTCEPVDIKNFKINGPQYSNGKIAFSVECEGKKDEYAKKMPSDFIDNLRKSQYFRAATYGGYVVSEETDKDSNEKVDKISFSTTVELVPNKSAYQPETESEEKTEEASE
jgi:type IV pilus assembly protein PilM